MSCGRISCSYNSAIYFCNDVSNPVLCNPILTLDVGNDYYFNPASMYLAIYARSIDQFCKASISGQFAVTCGQEFDADGYNIIVRSDSC